MVYQVHGDALGEVSDAIVGYVMERYGATALAVYAACADRLAILQERLEKSPSPATLGDPSATVDRDAYNVALLLSIVFTNHRFEIMKQSDRFLRESRANGNGRCVGRHGNRR